MSKSELIVGLDIGTTKICAVVGEPSENGGMDIVGIGTSPSTGLRKGVVVNIEQTVQSIKRALEEAELMAGCEIRSVYAGIAGSHIKGFNSHGVIAVKGGEVSPRDIERALDAAKAVAIPLDREVIHILPQEYIVDDQRGIADPMGMAGVRLEVKVHIVTGAVTSAQNIVRSCHKSGLDVSDIVLESLASAKAVLTEEERRDRRGPHRPRRRDLRHRHFRQRFHQAYGRAGAWRAEPDRRRGVQPPHAYGCGGKIRIKHGAAIAEMVRPMSISKCPAWREPRRLSRQVLAEIWNPRWKSSRSSIRSWCVRSQKHDRRGVVLTGGTALIQGCQELGERVFNLPTRIGYPRNVGGLKDMVNSAKFATAMGLLRFGAEKEGMEQEFPYPKRRECIQFDPVAHEKVVFRNFLTSGRSARCSL